MIINATAELYYNEGLSMVSGWERLQLIVKFKEQGKFFKTKLQENLANSFNYHRNHLVVDRTYSSMDEYYDHVEEIIADTEYVKECAISMIKEYFEAIDKEDSKNMRKSNTAKTVKDLPKIEIKVEIK